MQNHPLTAARERLGLTRRQLADAVNKILYPDPGQAAHSAFTANYLGKLENGKIRYPAEDYRTALRIVLNADTDDELGFRRRDISMRTKGMLAVRSNRYESSATGLSPAAAAPLTSDAIPLMSLLGPQVVDELPRQVSQEHIAQVLEAAEIFEQWDNAHGGALVREIADDKLHRLSRLLEVSCPAHLRPALHKALAQLAGVVAFMLFDAYHHEAARQRFTFALRCASIGGDWHQRAMLLSSLARQAVWCGQPDDGLTHIEMALVRADWLTASERAMLHTVRARALAKLGPGRAQEALAAVGAADEAFAHAAPAEDPPWMCFYDDAQHHGDTAHALFDVALHTSLVTESADRFAYSVEHHLPAYLRSRAISRIKLASLTMVQGDPLEAATIGNLALDDAGPVRSLRAADDLRELHRMAGPHGKLTEVQELRARIRETVGAVA
ncbi:hypothetical protein [Micromonospora sp. LOL_015]|uniref:hypothetical protein n=1 Tax=Micromonospora sp. LOL_015 TaxID=3345416 RepID=UPI003A8355A6